jgi:eukaryotic-like serine/threonine-protein kinase
VGTGSNDEAPPSVIAEKYKVEGVIGRGGMGVVYRATHTWTGRPVAVKVLRPEYARDEAIAQRFMNEARAAAMLRSENVVDVLDMGVDAEGAKYLALELLEGSSLASRLEASKTLTPAACASALLPVMDALSAAHAAGIVHRDLKPDNVFLHRTPAGREVPKLLDFGVAKFREASQKRTTTGTVLGTVLYMSPEQAHGDSDLGPASDVWAMGVVWYECLAGAPPFIENSLPATLLAITQGRRAPLAERCTTAPPKLVEAIERAITVDVKARWPDMRAFATAIRSALGLVEELDATMPAVAAVPKPAEAPIAPVKVTDDVAKTPTNEPWVNERRATKRTGTVVYTAITAVALAVAAAGGAAILGGKNAPQAIVATRTVVRAAPMVEADAAVARVPEVVDAGVRVVDAAALVDAADGAARERGGRRRPRRAEGISREY